MKNIKRILFILIVGICAFFMTDNVYAKEMNLMCKYRGEFGKIEIYEYNGEHIAIADTSSNKDPDYINVIQFREISHYGMTDAQKEAAHTLSFDDYGEKLRYTLLNGALLNMVTGTDVVGTIDEKIADNISLPINFGNEVFGVYYYLNSSWDISEGKCPDLYYSVEDTTPLLVSYQSLGLLKVQTFTFAPYKKDSQNEYANIERDMLNRSDEHSNIIEDLVNSIRCQTSYDNEQNQIIADLSFNTQFYKIKKSMEEDFDKYINNNLNEYNEQNFSILLYGNGNHNSLKEVFASKTNYYVNQVSQLIEDYITSNRCTLDETIIKSYLNQIYTLINTKYSDAKTKLEKALLKAVANGQISMDTKDRWLDNLNGQIDNAKTTSTETIRSIKDWYNELVGIDDESCTGLLDDDLVQIINRILNWARILVPILVIIFGTIDFSKAVLSEEKDEMSQAVKKFTKRVIIAIIIFFIPTLLHLLVNIYNGIADSFPDAMHRITDLPNCGIK